MEPHIRISFCRWLGADREFWGTCITGSNEMELGWGRFQNNVEIICFSRRQSSAWIFPGVGFWGF